MEKENSIRLQKYMANCGLGSRRFCETLISAGRVKVNNLVVKELGTKLILMMIRLNAMVKILFLKS